MSSSRDFGHRNRLLKFMAKPAAAVLSLILALTAPGPQAVQAASQVFKGGNKASPLPVPLSVSYPQNRLLPDFPGFSDPSFPLPAAWAPQTVPSVPSRTEKHVSWQETAIRWSEEMEEITGLDRPSRQYAAMGSLFDLSLKPRYLFAVPEESGSRPNPPGPSGSSQSDPGGASGKVFLSRQLKENILESSWKALGALYLLDRKASKQQIHDEIQSLLLKEQERLETAEETLSFLRELSSEVRRLAQDSSDSKEYRNALNDLTNRIKDWAILRADAPHPLMKAEQSDKVPAIQATAPAATTGIPSASQTSSDHKSRLDSQRRQERIAEWSMRAVYAALAVAGYYAPWSGLNMALYILFGHIMAVLLIVQPLEIYLRTNYGQGLSLKTAHFLVEWPQLIFYLSALSTVPLVGAAELAGIAIRPRIAFYSLLLAYNVFSAAWVHFRKSPLGLLRNRQFKPYITEFTPNLSKEIPELGALYAGLLKRVSGDLDKFLRFDSSEMEPVWNMLIMDSFSRTIFNLYKKRVSVEDMEELNIQYLPAGLWRKRVSDRSAVEGPSAAFRMKARMKDGREYSFILLIPREKDQTLEKEIFEIQNAILEYGEEYSQRIPALGAYTPLGKILTLADADWPFGDKLEPFFMKVALDAPESIEGRTHWEKVKAHLQKSGASYLKDKKWGKDAREALEQLGLR